MAEDGWGDQQFGVFVRRDCLDRSGDTMMSLALQVGVRASLKSPREGELWGAASVVMDKLFWVRWLGVLLLLLCPLGWGATYSVSAGQSQSAIQSVINGTSAGDTVIFSAGTYNVSSGWTLKCGVTYTGPATTPATAILNGTFSRESQDIFSLYPGSGYSVPCSAATTITYFHFENDGGVYVQTSFSNLTITHNQFTNLPCCNNQLHDPAIYLDGSQNSNNPNIQILNAATITGNTFGDLASCEGPSSGYMEDESTDDASNCAGVIVQTTVQGPLTISNNSFYHVAEGVHFLCVYGNTACEPGTGLTTTNVTGQYNDFSNIHRIAWEEQPQPASNILFEYNSYHDAYHPFGGNFDLSFACCNNGATSPSPVVTNNVLIQNLPSTGSYIGYGIEAWGKGGQYNNNLVEGLNAAPGITYGKGAAPWEILNNTICGPNWASAGNFIQAEYSGYPVPTESGNIEAASCSAKASAAPSISPAAGSYPAPLTVTLADAGYSSGSQPLGNTSVYYTTDGSTPVPGKGSTQLYTVPLTVTPPVTINAVGMWGSGANALSYPSGYGFVPSAMVSNAYTASGTGGISLTSVTLTAAGGANTLNLGQTLQMIATCHYSDGTMTGCDLTDSHGNQVTAWTSTTTNVTIDSNGLVTGAAIGTASVTATVTGGSSTAAYGLTVSAPALTLSSVSLATAGAVGTIPSGTTNQLIGTCHYSDGTTTNCGSAVDNHNNMITMWASTAPTVATVNNSGLVSGVAVGGTSLSASALPAPTQFGTNITTSSGVTHTGTLNYTYGVTGTSAGSYTVGNCYVYVPAGAQTSGAYWDCLLVAAPSPTTQASNALCSGRFTTSGTSWPGGFITIPMTSCPMLPPDTAYWLASTTNQSPTGARAYWNCGGTCNGPPPTVGSGTYTYFYLANTFGSYTGMPTALNEGGGNQITQYVTLATTPVTSAMLPLTVSAAPPTLSSAYLTAAGSSLVVGGTLQMAAHCVYTNPSATTDCTMADINGNAVTSWASSDITKATVGQVGGASPGLVTAVAAGMPAITAVINGGQTSSSYPVTVTAPTVSLTGLSIATTGGVTGLFAGSTNQLVATCSYSDGSTTNCTSVDSHGTVAGSYMSVVPGTASVNAASGLVTGVAPGSTMLSASAGGFNSPAIPLTVLAAPSGVYSIIISGPVLFAGTVKFQ